MRDFKYYPTWCICGNCNTLQFRSFVKRVRVGSRHFIEDCSFCGSDSVAFVVRVTNNPL